MQSKGAKNIMSMLARTIEFNVDVDSITPQGEQFGGLQGEHEATELVFNLSNNLLERTEDSLPDGHTLFLTLQVTDGAGGYHEYDLKGMEFGSVKTFLIPSAITSSGGVATFCLVFCDGLVNVDDDLNETRTVKTIIYSFPFKLKFKDTLTVGTPSQEQYTESAASILESARQYAEATRFYKEETQTLIENANEVITTLKDTTSQAWTYDRQLQRTNKEATSNIESLNLTISEAEDAEHSLKAILGNTNTVIEEFNNISEALKNIIALQEFYINGGGN